MDKRKVHFHDLGITDYKATWDYQEQVFHSVVDHKLQNREKETPLPPTHHLIFCEHEHVYTLGKSGQEEHLLLNEQGLTEKKAAFYKINRGGDITYHGPGQLVVYPIFDLEYFFTDIHKFLRYLEESVILTLNEFGIEAGRYEGLTGVWLDPQNPLKARKICAMGVRCSRWVTMHGIALNVNTDLNYFSNIIPCGIDDKQVTSIQQELQREVNMDEVKEKLKENLANIFDFDYV